MYYVTKQFVDLIEVYKNMSANCYASYIIFESEVYKTYKRMTK